MTLQSGLDPPNRRSEAAPRCRPRLGGELPHVAFHNRQFPATAQAVSWQRKAHVNTRTRLPNGDSHHRATDSCPRMQRETSLSLPDRLA